MFSRSLSAVVAVSALWTLTSCGSDAGGRKRPVRAIAYVGPISVNIRREISLHSPVVTTVKHGDKIGILEQRRRFILVRAPNGKEGWTDVRQIITPDQMAELNSLLRSASNLPSQGVASTFEPVNVHAEASRASPSFFQLKEGTRVDVIGHKLSPRVQNASAPIPRLIPRTPPRVVRHKKEDDRKLKLRPPPPPAPAVPQNWMDLSKTDEPPADKDDDEPVKRVPMDDWTQLRTPDGRVGWVLSSMVNMAIPDEVAQYSEGHRITSYFQMGTVHDGDMVKPNWLWTTQSRSNAPYDFDSFRYFIWNPRHHRYETAYVQRNVIGYYPIEAQAGSPPKFTLLMQDEDDGKLYRYYYIYDIYRVRLVGRQLWSADQKAQPIQAVPNAPVNEPSQRPSLLARVRQRISKLLGR